MENKDYSFKRVKSKILKIYALLFVEIQFYVISHFQCARLFLVIVRRLFSIDAQSMNYIIPAFTQTSVRRTGLSTSRTLDKSTKRYAPSVASNSFETVIAILIDSPVNHQRLYYSTRELESVSNCLQVAGIGN